MDEKLLKKVNKMPKIKEDLSKSTNVDEIIYYGDIKINNTTTKKIQTKSIYLIESHIEDRYSIQFYADNEVIATVLKEQDNRVVISPKYANIITPEMLLVKLEEVRMQGIEPISLEEAEEQGLIRQASGKTRTQSKLKKKEEKKKEEKEQEQEEKKPNYKRDIEISMNQYITVDKKIADIIPEIKQKQCQRVMARSKNNIDFEIYGIDKNGNEVEFNSLHQTEGTNPNQSVIKTNRDGSQVEKTQLSAMLRIQPGTNEQRGNEGIGIKIGAMGIPEVFYYRRDANDNYLAVPVGLETTNDKYAIREVKEIATKKYNPTIDDNIERAEERIGESGETTINNIDDNLENNTLDEAEMELIEEAAKRCKMDVKDFYTMYYEEAEGDTINEKIDNAEKEVNDAFRGKRERR